MEARPKRRIGVAVVQTSEAMLYDSVQLFAVALTELSRARDVRTTSLSCAKPRPWPHGSSLSNYVLTVSVVVFMPLRSVGTRATRVYGPCRRAVFTASVDRRPWTRPAMTGAQNDTRPWTRVMCTEPHFHRRCNAGRSLRWRRSSSSRCTGSRDLSQWAVGWQQQRRRRRLL